MPNNRRNHFTRARRVVIKVGSGVLTTTDGLNLSAIESLAAQICRISRKALQFILVSSGAMAAGFKKVGLERRPDETPQRQAVAAVGQASLILAYEQAFAHDHKKVAQVLLNSSDLADRTRHLNARNTLNTLLNWQILPIINENDTVSVREIQFGDNDNLAAMISLLMDADILINLTDIEGLFDCDPRKHPHARLIPVIEAVTSETEQLASDLPGVLGTGGMLSKIKAARKVTHAGIPMIIARGERQNVLLDLFAGHEIGTYFAPRANKMSRRKCWLSYNLIAQGALIIDQGAAQAIAHRGKSLLPSGILGVDGEFAVGAPVAFQTNGSKPLGIGLVNYNSSEIRLIKGLHTSQIEQALGQKTYDEVIHRDNLALKDDATEIVERAGRPR
jgi:glutamate 5-kinase